MHTADSGGAAPFEVTVSVGLDEPQDEHALREKIARKLQTSLESVPPLRLLKRSIDARGRRVRFQMLFGRQDEQAQQPASPAPREVRGPRDVVIVGDGPAGLFCAYELARHEIACTVVDRGKNVQPRRRDLKGLNQQGTVDADSNYCFGEGGAGTYSDGKLYTRAHKRGNVRDVIEILVEHGAPERILTDARPHIGSNILPKVVTALRERLQQVGVEFRFGCKVIGLETQGHGTDRRVQAVQTEDDGELAARQVVLATGHSARDVLVMLHEQGVRLESKPFALGARIEHPQPLINAIQYGQQAGHPALPNAYYRLACTIEQRGVFSFCMCPGGFIVPAATEPRGLVVNGMSLSRRDSPFANSGFVVGVEPEDWQKAGFAGPLGGIAFQRAIEQAGFEAGGGALVAPATRVTDLLAGRGSTTVAGTSYVPGTVAGDIAEVLDAAGVAISARLRSALGRFEARMRGYITAEASLIGVESRTSSPVRVPRDAESLCSPDLAGLYPCGEGAGYAGGIMSAALDGIRVARAIVERRKQTFTTP